MTQILCRLVLNNVWTVVLQNTILETLHMTCTCKVDYLVNTGYSFNTGLLATVQTLLLHSDWWCHPLCQAQSRNNQYFLHNTPWEKFQTEITVVKLMMYSKKAGKWKQHDTLIRQVAAKKRACKPVVFIS